MLVCSFQTKYFTLNGVNLHLLLARGGGQYPKVKNVTSSKKWNKWIQVSRPCEKGGCCNIGRMREREFWMQRANEKIKWCSIFPIQPLFDLGPICSSFFFVSCLSVCLSLTASVFDKLVRQSSSSSSCSCSSCKYRWKFNLVKKRLQVFVASDALTFCIEQSISRNRIR